MSEAIKIRRGRRIRKIDLLRNPGVDIASRMTDEMVSSVAQDAIERIKRAGSKFVRILDAVPFRDDEIMIEVAAAIIPIGEQAYLESRGREYERERQRARDLTAKLNIAEGAATADEERTKAAAVRVWGEHVRGCDTVDAMADLIEAQRAEIAVLKSSAAEQKPTMEGPRGE